MCIWCRPIQWPDHDVWFIESSASFHMKPHKEWFYENEIYEGGDVFLGDDLTIKIVGRGRIQMILYDRRSMTLPGVLHILVLARNLIYVSKMSDADVHTLF
jgi:hypothetical protein